MQGDLFKLTVVYLRLWKYCDVVVQQSETQQSSKFLEISSVNELVLEQELHSFAGSKLDWADNPSMLLEEIKDTIALGRKLDKSANDYKVLSSYRDSFQQKALKYSGELTYVQTQRA